MGVQSYEFDRGRLRETQKTGVNLIESHLGLNYPVMKPTVFELTPWNKFFLLANPALRKTLRTPLKDTLPLPTSPHSMYLFDFNTIISTPESGKPIENQLSVVAAGMQAYIHQLSPVQHILMTMLPPGVTFPQQKLYAGLPEWASIAVFAQEKAKGNNKETLHATRIEIIKSLMESRFSDKNLRFWHESAEDVEKIIFKLTQGGYSLEAAINTVILNCESYFSYSL